MLSRENAVVVLVDLQEKLARAMHEPDRVARECARLLAGARALKLPVLCTEQNPLGLGRTLPEAAALLDAPPIPKRSFSCLGEAAFRDALAKCGRRQVLLAGIEAHVCVYQTAADLLAAGWEVHAVCDAVSSRTSENRQVGLAKMQAAGAHLTSVETALFELLRVAEGPEFKEILRIVK